MKMKMKKIIKAILCVLVCVGCSSPREANTEDILVDVKELSSLNHVYENYRYVRLKTPEHHIINSIDKIVPTDSMLFIKDVSTIYICNYEGEFLNTINHRGHGRGEYVKINDFDVFDNTLWILDSQLQKLMLYGLDGTFVCEYRLPDYYHSLSIQRDGKVFLCAQQSNDDLYNFVLFDPKTNQVVNRLAKFKMNNGCIETNFHDFIGMRGDTLIVANRFDYTIYNLTADDYSPRLSFAFNTNESLPDNTEELDYAQLLEQTQFKGIVQHPYLYYQNSSRIVLGYYLFNEYGDSYYLTSITTDGEQRTARLMSEVDDDFPYASPVLTQYGDELVSYLHAGGVLNIEKNIQTKLFTDMGVTQADNPIIFFHHIKGN